MRTTIEIPDAMFREMKALTARQGMSLKEFTLRAIEKQISHLRDRGKKKYSVKLPLIPSKHPGTLRSMTNAEIEDLLG